METGLTISSAVVLGIVLLLTVHATTVASDGPSMAVNRAELVKQAKLGDKVGRYDDVAGNMKAAAKLAIASEYSFNTEERDLLRVGYDHLAAVKRASLENLADLEGETTIPEDLQRIKIYRAVIEAELVGRCQEAVKLVDDLLPESPYGEDQVFYHKMEGDFQRYIAETQKDPNRAVMVMVAEQAYKEAVKKARKYLASTNPLRLRLALDYSLFLYETKGEHDQACRVLDRFLDDAVGDLDTEERPETTLLTELLANQLRIWDQREEYNKTQH